MSSVKGSEIRRFETWLPVAFLLGVLCLVSACAAGRIAGEVYQDTQRGFQVRLPRGAWLPTALDGAALSFAWPELQAAMALRVDCRTAEAGELPWVARHLFFGLEESRVHERETLRLHDASAVRTRVRARLDGAPVEVEGVTIRRAGCLYDFMFVAPPSAFPRGRPDFAAFVQSWAPLSER